MDRQRRPSDSFPELVIDQEEKTDPDLGPVPPRPRRRTATPARALEALPGFEPGREVGRREGVILACETFLAAWLSNPKNDVGVAHLQAQEMARRCGVKWAPLPGARGISGAAPAARGPDAVAGELGAARPPPPAGRRGR